MLRLEDLDTNKIAKELADALDYVDVEHDLHVLENDVIPAWFKAKRGLLEVLSRHPQWNQNTLSIHVDEKYSRIPNFNTSNILLRKLLRGARDHYVSAGNNEKVIEILNQTSSLVYLLHREFMHHADSSQPVKITNKDLWNEAFPSQKSFRDGQRLSRALNRIFVEKDWNFGAYEKDFAALADSLNPMPINRHTFLSLHPADYILMSNGNSWDSCHLPPNGGWCGGTWSYMLDDITGIFYTLMNSDEQPWMAKKVNRAVCCFDGPTMMFSRLYPQDQTRDFGLRKQSRNVVEKIYSECLGETNLWQAPLNAADGSIVRSGDGGLQYYDYTYSEFLCEVLTLKDHETRPLYIGASAICPTCGKRYGRFCGTDNMRCPECEGEDECVDCGRRFNAGDHDYTMDDEPLCRGCQESGRWSYCGNCHHWTQEELEYVQDTCERVCESCARDDCHRCYNCGELYCRDYNVTEIGGEYYCDDCRDRNFTLCENCGDYASDFEIVETEDGYSLCRDCEDEAYTCDCCGLLYYRGRRTVFSGNAAQKYCEHCFALQEKEA